MPIAHASPEAAGGRDQRQQQREQPEEDRGGARQHRLRRTTQGARHREVARRRDLQLVAVARDQQQRVVGAGAEDEHREDARGRGVPGDAEDRHDLGREDRGEPVGHGHDGERDQPQHRAAVGEQQQQRDHAGRGQQQPHVGAVEDRGEVGRDRCRSGDLGGHAVGSARRRLLAQVGHGVVGGGRCSSPRPGRRPGRRSRPSTAPASASSGPSSRGLVLEVGELLLRELALVRGVEHDRDRGVVLGQLVAQLGGRRAVRAAGQRVRRALVVGALAEQPERERGQDEGQQRHGPRRTASGDQSDQTGRGGRMGVVARQGGWLPEWRSDMLN